jgi:lipopolysaccharide biosynthesis protein
VNKNYLLYAFFDRGGKIDFHVVDSLKRYNKFFQIIFISNIKITELERQKIRFVYKIIEDEHKEMDFGSWKIGIRFLKNRNVKNLALVNDSVIGPITSFRIISERMKKEKIDFWGITSAGKDSRFHLQSYFLHFNERCFDHNCFKKFFKSIKQVHSKSELVKRYEIGLTQTLLSNGLKCNSYLPNFEKDIHSQEDCIDLFNKKELPFFKVKNIISNPYRLRMVDRVFKTLGHKEEYTSYIKRVNGSNSIFHLRYILPKFRKVILSKSFLIIRAKFVCKNKLWRFYVKFLGIYIFFFIFPVKSNSRKVYTSDKNYK